MRVVPQSFEILSELDNGSMANRIESCGRICYKSEGKITDESAEPFIKNILKRGHNSVAEMAVFTLKISNALSGELGEFYEVIPRYLSVDKIGAEQLLISGSVRAFREIYTFNKSISLIKSITAFLNNRNPLFFSDLPGVDALQINDSMHIEKIPLSDVETLPQDLLRKHRSIAVKFITNRAVTHELVRHRPCTFLQESQRYCRYDKDQFGSEVTFIKPLFYKEGTPEYKIWEKAMIDTEKLYLKLLETSSPQAARTVLPNSCKTEIIVYATLAEWLHIFTLRTAAGAEPSMREIMNPLLAKFKLLYPSIFEVVTA